MASNDEIKIETDVPVPVPASRRTYPFDKMEVGDSFFLPLAANGFAEGR